MTYKEIGQSINELIKQALELEFDLDLKKVRLVQPPEPKMGDLSFECFEVAKKLKKNPAEVASKLVKAIKSRLLLRQGYEGQVKLGRITSAGPYLNFFIDDNVLFSAIIKDIIKQGDKIGKNDIGQNQTVIIEYSSPNTNKPQHIGHLRNNFLGDSLARILETQSWQVKKVSIINDRGAHICKSMLMYQKYGNNQSPKDQKPDHFVGNFYEMYAKQKNQEKLKREVQEMLKKWENGDKKIMELWKKMNGWVYQGWGHTYQILDITFDKVYYESDIYKLGKNIVEEGVKKQIFYKRDDGAIEVDLTEYGMDKKVLIRADGTSIYITMDLALAKLKFQDFPKTVKSIYVVGSAQEYHFKVLFKILELLGYKNIDAYYHLSYGMVRLSQGKMSSRHGNVVNADDLIKQVVDLAKEEIGKRQSKSDDERATKIGLGALKYYLLHVGPKKDIIFDAEKAVSFEGDAGPYIMYTYARMASIKSKCKNQNAKWKIKNQKLTTTKLNKEERGVVNKLSQFRTVLQWAGTEYNPAILAHYLFELSTSINSFYHKHQVLKAPDDAKTKRLMLLEACGIVIKKGLALLGIEAVDKM
jgi:arginyl-tRNA synthetase